MPATYDTWKLGGRYHEDTVTVTCPTCEERIEIDIAVDYGHVEIETDGCPECGASLDEVEL